MQTVAAIDAGSNAIRLAIIHVGPTGVLLRKFNKRYPLRLGSEVFKHNKINPTQINKLLNIFNDIAKKISRLKVSRYRAVATSAWREAQNASEIVQKIKQTTGISLEIITGAEEGRIMRLTLMRALGTISSNCLLIDLGGGSLELEWTTTRNGISIPWGTLKLLQRYPCLQETQKDWQIKEIFCALRDEIAKNLNDVCQTSLAIGTGGNLDALARLAPVVNSNVPAIDPQLLSNLIRQLGKITPDQRSHKYNLRKDRGDVILPAALVILSLIEIYQLKTILVPGTGIRESLLFTLVNEDYHHTNARQLLQTSSFDLNMPERRARIARRIFELLAALHGLWPPALAPLETAAYLLNDSGLHDRKHTALAAIKQIISSHELDLNEKSRKVAAFAIKYALQLDIRLGKINKIDNQAAKTVGAILHLAMALMKADDSWEPHIELTKDPINIIVNNAECILNEDLKPVEQIIKKRLHVSANCMLSNE
ncbi:MAG: hypothetical protein JW841_06230 [Deltaproteobacteria bacterium]|nr:hypothetical protein [Deltaproteobacteria bacterium]